MSSGLVGLTKAARQGARLKAFPLPGAPGADQLAVVGFSSLVHSRTSPNPEGARAFLRALTSEGGQLTLLGDTGATLRRVDLSDSRLSPFARMTAQHLRTAVDADNLVLSVPHSKLYQECFPNCGSIYRTPLVIAQSASADALVANAREFYTAFKASK
jgi:hypothetical protein